MPFDAAPTSSILFAIRLFFPTWSTVCEVFLLGVLATIVITPLEKWAPAYQQPLIKRSGFILDLWYWFATPLLSRTISGLVLAVIIWVIVLALGLDLRSINLLEGFGPIAQLPHWMQIAGILVVADFCDYWTHRWMHLGPLWRVHAIHHSPEEMSWLSSSRVHPLNDLITRAFQLFPIAALGFSLQAVLAVVPLVSFYVMFLHANVRWNFGPLRWLIVSPAYHRWHHTSDLEGIDKNFSGIFPIWDLLFGTAYFPKHLPQHYGLNGEKIPETFMDHLLYPLRGM